MSHFAEQYDPYLTGQTLWEVAMLTVRIRTSFRHLSPRSVGTVLVLALLSLSVCLALSDSEIARTPSPPQSPRGLMKIAPEHLSPRLREIRERLELERTQLEPLREEFRKATDPEKAREIASRMSELKTQTEGDILGIQLKFARVEGKSEQVEALERMIAQRSAPVLTKSEEAPVRRHRQEGSR